MAKILTSKTVDGIRAALVVVLYAILLTPLLVSSRYFFPFITTKTLYFRLLIEIAAALYLILLAADIRFRPVWNKVSKAVTIYLGIVFVTAITGLNFYRSFWGNTERGEGVITFIHVVALFIILLSVFRTWKEWERYFTASVLVSLASALYATAQKLGWDISFVLAGDVSRISATIGNAAFYAGYLLTNMYLALLLYFRSNKTWHKAFFVAVIVYEAIILNATRTRGALVGLILSVVVVLVLAAITSSNKKVRSGTLIGLAVLVGLGIAVYALRDTTLILKSGGLHNITHISRDDITTESRLLTWQASLKGWQDRFFLGYGYENFNIPFNKYFPAEIYRDAGSQIWFDRAHNVFFENAVTTGIFGILAYLGIYLMAIVSLFRFYRANPEENRTTSLVLLGFLVSYFVQNLFVFDTLGTYISFYSVLAFIVFLQTQETQEKQGKYFDARINPYLTLAIIAVTCLAIYYSVYKPHKSNIQVTSALITASQGNLQATIDNYRKVIDSNTYATEEARQKLAEAVITLRDAEGNSPQLKTRSFQFAVEQLRAAIEESPYDARNYLFLMAVYNNYPENNPGLREEVIRLGNKALELSPTRPQIYYEMGQAAHALGRYDEGISYFEKAVEINPNPAESHWNLALAYFIAGEDDKGEGEIDWLFDNEKISKINEANLRNLVSIYNQKGFDGRNVRIFKELVARKPKDAKQRAELASLYSKLCMVPEAEEQVSKAVSLDSSYTEQAQSFIAEMRQRCGQ